MGFRWLAIAVLAFLGIVALAVLWRVSTPSVTTPPREGRSASPLEPPKALPREPADPPDPREARGSAILARGVVLRSDGTRAGGGVEVLATRSETAAPIASTTTDPSGRFVLREPVPPGGAEAAPPDELVGLEARDRRRGLLSGPRGTSRSLLARGTCEILTLRAGGSPPPRSRRPVGRCRARCSR